jgi:large repetitive protein
MGKSAAAMRPALMSLALLIGSSTPVLAQPSSSSVAPPARQGAPGPTLLEPRTNHTATLLPDGRVLIVGGFRDVRDTMSDLASAELWDPATGVSTPAGSMAVGRAYHTATLLRDGRVLVVGGRQRLAEVWDPQTLTFSPAGDLPFPVLGSTATLLPDGRVLVAGGDAAALTTAQLEHAQLWDPATAAFSQADRLLEPRSFPTASLLQDGRVLILGGETAVRSAEVWDPGSSSFSREPRLRIGRWGHTATVLPDGSVLVTGGTSVTSGFQFIREWTLASTELRNATTGRFSAAGRLRKARTAHSATLLPDGRILLIGGDGPGGIRRRSEVWDPVRQRSHPAAALAEARFDHTATLLPDGRVAVIGGTGRVDRRLSSLASIEIIDPPATAVSPAPAPPTPVGERPG